MDATSNLDHSDATRLVLLDNVLRTMCDGVMVLDSELKIVIANEWMDRRYSRGRPLAGQKCYRALYGRLDTCPACPSLRSREKAAPQTQVVKVSGGPDRAEWFEVRSYPWDGAAGGPAMFVEHMKDITGLKQSEERLRQAEAERRALFEESPSGIVVLSLDGSVCEANGQFAKLLGYTSEEVRTLHVWDWDTRWEKEWLLQMLQRADVSDNDFETSYRRKDDSLVPVEVSSTGSVRDGERVVLCTCRDASDKKVLQDRIRELGIRDPVTGAYNRRYIFDRLIELSAEVSRGAGEFCVSLLDLDNFQGVNDVHGHRAGDIALEEFARTMTSLVRPYDLFGRFGGEEFIIVSRNATAPETTAMIDRLMGVLRSKTFSFEGHQIRLTFSCGLAQSSELARDSFSVETLIARAEQRLRQAKAGGKDRCVGPGGATGS